MQVYHCTTLVLNLHLTYLQAYITYSHINNVFNYIPRAYIFKTFYQPFLQNQIFCASDPYPNKKKTHFARNFIGFTLFPLCITKYIKQKFLFFYRLKIMFWLIETFEYKPRYNDLLIKI